jgi:hypothetical protein
VGGKVSRSTYAAELPLEGKPVVSSLLISASHRNKNERILRQWENRARM